ncbi:MAG: amidohydrolase family protein, partial [Acidimicrobiia bacterium]
MSQRADLILVSARIWDGTELAADAIAIADGLVVATGSSREILGLVSGATEVLDVGGRRVIPGLIDSHIHMIRAGLSWNEEV